jgi:hypothetical protein
MTATIQSGIVSSPEKTYGDEPLVQVILSLSHKEERRWDTVQQSKIHVSTLALTNAR